MVTSGRVRRSRGQRVKPTPSCRNITTRPRQVLLNATATPPAAAPVIITPTVPNCGIGIAKVSLTSSTQHRTFAVRRKTSAKKKHQQYMNEFATFSQHGSPGSDDFDEMDIINQIFGHEMLSARPLGGKRGKQQLVRTNPVSPSSGYGSRMYERAANQFHDSSPRQSTRKNNPFNSDDEYFAHFEFASPHAVHQNRDTKQQPQKRQKRNKRRDFDNGSESSFGETIDLNDVLNMLGDEGFANVEYLFDDLHDERQEKRTQRKMERAIKSKRLARTDGVEVFDSQDVAKFQQDIEMRHHTEDFDYTHSHTQSVYQSTSTRAATLDDHRNKTQAHEAQVVYDEGLSSLHKNGQLQDSTHCDIEHDMEAIDPQRAQFFKYRLQHSDPFVDVSDREEQLYELRRRIEDQNMDLEKKAKAQREIDQLEHFMKKAQDLYPNQNVTDTRTNATPGITNTSATSTTVTAPPPNTATTSYIDQLRANGSRTTDKQLDNNQQSLSISSQAPSPSLNRSTLLDTFLNDANEQAAQMRREKHETDLLLNISKEDIKHISFGLPLDLNKHSPQEVVEEYHATLEQSHQAKRHAYALGLRGQALMNVGHLDLGPVKLDPEVEKKMDTMSIAYTNLKTVVNKLNDKLTEHNEKHTGENVNLGKMMKGIRQEMAIDNAGTPGEKAVLSRFSNIAKEAYQMNTKLEEELYITPTGKESDKGELIYWMDPQNVSTYDDIIAFVDYAVSAKLPIAQIQNVVASHRERVERFEKERHNKEKLAKIRAELSHIDTSVKLGPGKVEREKKREQMLRQQQSTSPYINHGDVFEANFVEDNTVTNIVTKKAPIKTSTMEDALRAHVEKEKRQASPYDHAEAFMKTRHGNIASSDGIFRDDYYDYQVARDKTQKRKKESKLNFIRSIDSMAVSSDDDYFADGYDGVSFEATQQKRDNLRNAYQDPFALYDDDRVDLASLDRSSSSAANSPTNMRHTMRDRKAEATRLHEMYHGSARRFSTLRPLSLHLVNHTASSTSVSHTQSLVSSVLSKHQTMLPSSFFLYQPPSQTSLNKMRTMLFSSQRPRPGKLNEMNIDANGSGDGIRLNSLLATPSHREKQLSGETLLPKASRKQQQFSRERVEQAETQQRQQQLRRQYEFGKLANERHTEQYINAMTKKIRAVDDKNATQVDSEQYVMPEKQGKKAARIANLKNAGKFKEKYVPKQTKLDIQMSRAIYESTHDFVTTANGNKVPKKKKMNGYEKALAVRQQIHNRNNDYISRLGGSYPTTQEEASYISPNARKPKSPAWLADMDNDPFMLNNNWSDDEFGNEFDESITLNMKNIGHGEDGQALNEADLIGLGADATPLLHFKTDPQSLITERKIDLIPEEDGTRFENIYAKSMLQTQVEQELQGNPQLFESLLSRYNKKLGLGEFADHITENDNDSDLDNHQLTPPNHTSDNDPVLDLTSSIILPSKENNGDLTAGEEELERAMSMLMSRSSQLGVDQDPTTKAIQSKQKNPSSSSIDNNDGDNKSPNDTEYIEQKHQLQKMQHKDMTKSLSKAELIELVVQERYEIAYQAHIKQKLHRGELLTQEEQIENFEKILERGAVQHKIDQGLGFITELEVDEPIIDQTYDDNFDHYHDHKPRHGEKNCERRQNYQFYDGSDGEKGTVISKFNAQSGLENYSDLESDEILDSMNLYLPRKYLKLHKKGLYNQKSARRKSKEQLMTQFEHSKEWGRDTDELYDQQELLSMKGVHIDDSPEDMIRQKRLQRYLQKSQRIMTQNNDNTVVYTNSSKHGHDEDGDSDHDCNDNYANMDDDEQYNRLFGAHKKLSGHGDGSNPDNFAKMVKNIREMDESELLERLVADSDHDNGSGGLTHNSSNSNYGHLHHNCAEDFNDDQDPGFYVHRTLKNTKKQRERDIIDITELRDEDNLSDFENDEFYDTDEEEYVKGHEYSSQNLAEKPKPVGKIVGGDAMYSFELHEEDLFERFVRGSGPGGQSVNKTKNCVFLQHGPTGTIVKCAQTRELPVNRAIARKIMKRKLEALFQGKESYLGRKIERLQRRKQRSKQRHAISDDQKSGKRDAEILKLKQKLGFIEDSSNNNKNKSIVIDPNAPSIDATKM